jgi:flagellar M-ring protein FliF
VRSAVGFNEGRGDKVEVVSMRFAEAPSEAPEGGPLGLDIPQAMLARLAETAVLGVVAILALLLLGRPAGAQAQPVARPAAGAGPGQGGALRRRAALRARERAALDAEGQPASLDT